MGKEIEDLELTARRRLEVEIEPAELARIEGRLEALKAALGALVHLLAKSNEPLTMAVLEDE
jgi:hypothetical protein